jgi:hypothetical protein
MGHKFTDDNRGLGYRRSGKIYQGLIIDFISQYRRPIKKAKELDIHLEIENAPDLKKKRGKGIMTPRFKKGYNSHNNEYYRRDH